MNNQNQPRSNWEARMAEFMDYQPMGYIPAIIEESGGRERAYDLYSYLMKSRIIFIGTAINQHIANAVVAQLLYLFRKSETKPIKMYIQSPGGSVSAGLAIYDTMKFIPNPIETFCVGTCASMASVLLSSGTKGHRYCLTNADVMIHQPLGGFGGQASDMRIAMNHMDRCQNRLYKILAENTSKSMEQITTDCDRDNWLSAEESVAYGLVDKVITKAVQEKMESDEGNEEEDDK